MRIPPLVLEDSIFDVEAGELMKLVNYGYSVRALVISTAANNCNPEKISSTLAEFLNVHVRRGL